MVGYLDPATGSSYAALPAPVRIVDTRTGNGGAGNGGAPRPRNSRTSDVFWGSGIFAVRGNRAVHRRPRRQCDQHGLLHAVPGVARPAASTSTLNFSAGRVVPNAAIVGLSANKFGLFNNLGKADAAIGLFGYFI